MELQLGNRRLAFDDVGQGRPVVLLHPFPFDRRFWAPTVAKLAPRFRAIVPDLRGFGQSTADGDFSIADLADDVSALLHHLHLPRAILVGLSMGGYVTLAFAARHAAQLAGMVLADTKASADTTAARAARQEALDLVASQGAAAYVAKQLPRLIPVARLGDLGPTVTSLCSTDATAVARGLRALRDRDDRTAQLPSFQQPALVVVGEEDTLTPPTDAQEMAAALPRGVLVQLPGVGHLSALEAPEPFWAALSGFLSANADRSPTQP